MTEDRVREMSAWASVLVAQCERYLIEPERRSQLPIHEAIRNLAICMDRACDEETPVS